MESLSLEDENIIKDIRNIFRLKNELNYTAIKDTTHSAKLRPESVLRTSPKDVLWTTLFGPLCNAKGRPIPTF